MTYNKAGTQAPLSAAAFDAAATGMDVYLDRRRCFVRAFPDMHLGSDTPPSQWFISSLCRCAPSPTCTLRSSSRTRRCAAASRVSSLLRPPPHTTQHARGTRLPIDPSSAVHAARMRLAAPPLTHASRMLPAPVLHPTHAVASISSISSTRHALSPPSPPSPLHHRFTTASPPLHRTAGRRPGLHFVAVDGHAPRPVPLPQLRGRVRRHPAERLPRRAPGAYAPPHHSPRRHPPRASASDPPSLADNVLLLLPPPSLASAPRASSSLSDPSRASAPTFRAAVRRVPSRSARPPPHPHTPTPSPSERLSAACRRAPLQGIALDVLMPLPVGAYAPPLPSNAPGDRARRLPRRQDRRPRRLLRRGGHPQPAAALQGRQELGDDVRPPTRPPQHSCVLWHSSGGGSHRPSSGPVVCRYTQLITKPRADGHVRCILHVAPIGAPRPRRTRLASTTSQRATLAWAAGRV